MSESIYREIRLDDPWNEFRLVVLEPAVRSSDAIRCRLLKAPLDRKIGYAALSYVWGSTTDSIIILVNGVKFSVTRNLYDALLGLRARNLHLQAIWIDAISIDQACIREREAQVTQMDKIFGQAVQVVSWIGEAENDYDKLLLQIDVHRLQNHGDNLKTMDIEKAGIQAKDIINNEFSDRICDALKHVANNPYWERAWVVQEITVGPRLVFFYGRVELPWTIFLAIISLYTTIGLSSMSLTWKGDEKFREEVLAQFAGAVGPSIRGKLKNMRNTSERRGLLSILSMHATTKATDIRDKIFAFCGLAGDSRELVTIDYSIPAVGLYKKFARKYIELSQSYQILQFAVRERDTHQHLKNLPSWVPDWSEQSLGSTYNIREDSLFSAAKETRIQFQFRQSSSILIARGIPIDSVSVYLKDRNLMYHEEVLFLCSPYEYPTGVPRLQALFRTLVADQYVKSDRRFNDDPDMSLFNLMNGFLADLGVQSKPETYGHIFGATETTSLHSGHNDDIHNRPQKTNKYSFISAFHDWAEECIRLLDALIEHYALAKPAIDVAIENAPIHKRVDHFRQLSRLQQAQASDQVHSQNGSDYTSCLLAWKQALESTRDCQTTPETLQLFLGVRGSRGAIEWPEPTFTRSERTNWMQFIVSRTASTGDCLFGTHAGYIGSGPRTIQGDDLICVLYGSDYPIMLRPKGDRFSVVGFCYVQGLMDGEAIDGLGNGTFVEQEFMII